MAAAGGGSGVPNAPARAAAPAPCSTWVEPPGRATRKPAAVSSSYAPTAAVLDRPNVAASVRVDGSRSPSWTCPAAMASISACATWLARGPVRPFRASVKLTGVAALVTWHSLMKLARSSAIAPPLSQNQYVPDPNLR